MKVKVAFVINSLAGGGAERSIINLLKHSGDYLKKYDVHLILLDKLPHAYEPPTGIEIHCLSAKGSLWRSAFQLCKSLNSLKPEIVISSLTRSNFSNILASMILKHRALICEHAYTSGHYVPGMRGLIAKRLITLVYPRADRVISVSRDIRNDLIENFGIPAAKALTLVNPIDMAAIEGLSVEPASAMPDKRYIVGMGRMVDSKNFPLLLQGFAESSFQGDLVIMGTGPRLGSVETLARELGIKDRVHFLGFMKNPYSLLRHATAYVLSSNGEGLPTGIIEAMSLGVPIIATNCRSGPYEILEDDDFRAINELKRAKYGVLVPPNSPADMSKAISLFEVDDVRAELAALAVEGSKRYRLDEAVQSYWTLIDEMTQPSENPA